LKWSRTELRTMCSISAAGARRIDPARSAVPCMSADEKSYLYLMPLFERELGSYDCRDR
jgi:hypothetical protein